METEPAARVIKSDASKLAKQAADLASELKGKGQCPVCRVNVDLSKSGVIGPHEYGNGQCSGTGLDPIK